MIVVEEKTVVLEAYEQANNYLNVYFYKSIYAQTQVDFKSLLKESVFLGFF